MLRGLAARSMSLTELDRLIPELKKGTANLLRFGGSRQLSEDLVAGLHAALLGL